MSDVFTNKLKRILNEYEINIGNAAEDELNRLLSLGVSVDEASVLIKNKFNDFILNVKPEELDK